MSVKIEDLSRIQIAEFLPDALKTAITSYETYMKSKNSENPADFKEMHTTGKAALSHIELLLKLARWADLPDAAAENNNQQVILGAMMLEAEAELAGYHIRSMSVEEDETLT